MKKKLVLFLTCLMVLSGCRTNGRQIDVTFDANTYNDYMTKTESVDSLNYLMTNDDKDLSLLGNLIDGLGGLPGILSVVSTLKLKAFGKDISESIGRVIYNIKLTSEAGRQEIHKLRKDASQQMSDMTANDGTRTGGAVADVYSKQHQIQDALLNKTEELAAS